MPVYGIISEFNPFHNGHKYLIDCARRSGAEAVVCVMSGNAVQRGEGALVDKYSRARMALLCGADLVLELPYPYSASSAESFAGCGIGIASEFADTLIFGSECGDISSIKRAAELSADRAFAEEYRDRLRGNSGTAEIYFGMLREKLGVDFSSNDILGIEYVKAAILSNSKLEFKTVKRVGGEYSSSELTEGDMQSATALRVLIKENRFDELRKYMPSQCVEELSRACENREISSAESIDNAVRLFFRLHSPEDFEEIAEIDSGLAERICRVARDSSSGSLLPLLCTKRYTDARLRRAILFCMTGVRKEDIRSGVAYVNLLGANDIGRELLSRKRKTAGIQVIAKQADIPNTRSADRQAELSARFDSLYSLTLSEPREAGCLLRKSPIIIERKDRENEG